MNVSLFRYAFVLVLLSLVGAFFVPAMAVPRLALSAHTIGILGALLMIAVGALWPHFRLGPAQAAWHKWSWIYSSYANWLACLAGAALGAGRMTPIAAAGRIGGDGAETLVAALFVSVGVVSLLAAGLSLWGLRPGAEPGAN